ncbi:hypothetical protein ALQ59_03670 [Pseudomonas syringae pv. apii]|uniref:YjiS-like domain-containing protein n=2 Tax=Pseudomonas TaxID=286 RepID=A0A3M3MFD7_9PSED|nr:hypothetical protein ALQ59_03670 [Pseudomonas syringae pv. apii]RMN51727.1 hypothetical protein ALQ58_04200 [Pseudomonas syringae pv. apii]RMN98983.1 hypothetical protein ALQ49_03596 [Pseudomonas syringae pv. apii]
MEMNGFSDVRLALNSQELNEYRPTVLRTVRPKKADLLANMSRWALYRHRWASRRTLLTLTDDQLRDVGLDFQQARVEAMKPFWRA